MEEKERKREKTSQRIEEERENNFDRFFSISFASVFLLVSANWPKNIINVSERVFSSC